MAMSRQNNFPDGRERNPQASTVVAEGEGRRAELFRTRLLLCGCTVIDAWRAPYEPIHPLRAVNRRWPIGVNSFLTTHIGKADAPEYQALRRQSGVAN